MTRTARNQNAAALVKERHSRSGLTNRSESQRKNGAGAHNWGSFQQEGEYELEANNDARRESVADQIADAEVNGDEDDMPFEMDNADDVAPLPKDKANNNNNNDNGGDSDDNVEGYKVDNKDLVSASPTDSMSSFDSVEHKAVQGRRMSNVSDAERERARVYREGVMHKPTGSIDLAHIARTSYGIAQSPPSNNGAFFSTSPVKSKGRQ